MRKIIIYTICCFLFIKYTPVIAMSHYCENYQNWPINKKSIPSEITVVINNNLITIDFPEGNKHVFIKILDKEENIITTNIVYIPSSGVLSIHIDPKFNNDHLIIENISTGEIIQIPIIK